MVEDRISRLLSILTTEGDSFKLHDAAQKAMFHRENFTAFLEGRDRDVQPVTVEIVPSLECNQRCPRCTYTQNQSKAKYHTSQRTMTTETFINIMEGLKSLPQTKSLIFTGGGEPLMHRLIIAFMNSAVSHFGYEIGLYTNGTLLNDFWIQRIMEIAPAFVRVSLNAGTLETHAKVYGYNLEKKNYFEIVTRNIVSLAKAKARLSSKTIVGIGIIISEKNYLELPEIADLMIRLSRESDGNIKYVAIRPEVCYFDEKLRVVKTQPNTDIFSQISDEIEKEVGEKVRPEGMDVLVNRAGFEHLVKPYTNTPNIANSWSASFDYDGLFYITSEHNGMQGFSMGDVRKESPGAIWQGETRGKLMADMASGKIKTLPYFKLKTLNDMLLRIRTELGVLTSDEVTQLYQLFPLESVPEYVNFI
ncbi:hypothetical protein A2V71_00835 [Candidatus Berkelbacteria bacterium RBG_13_40_8]|uniref:Radical SAM core domain-containing protein n=1 Tax=Candidatus Berkelbacteria bacterium RBG_13_40_8 TaxID=1797467 RepID=A0A1F5DQ96_9BACT|nr:MAG: hypothetical protein A2V71_00835 [Candidatus Berkelbacteria bacterium RBG_13_40_8]